MTEAEPTGCDSRWTGDLNDDCTLRQGNLVSRAECMASIRCVDHDGHDDPFDSEIWYCAVYRTESNGSTTPLFHDAAQKGAILGGEMARAVCEAILNAYR